MKREHRKKVSGVSRTFSLFSWCYCERCGKDFRRELGWRFMDGPFHGTTGRERYVCGECAPDREAIEEYYLSKDWRSRGPAGAPGT